VEDLKNSEFKERLRLKAGLPADADAGKGRLDPGYQYSECKVTPGKRHNHACTCKAQS
jgi:hypothetical protein